MSTESVDRARLEFRQLTQVGDHPAQPQGLCFEAGDDLFL